MKRRTKTKKRRLLWLDITVAVVAVMLVVMGLWLKLHKSGAIDCKTIGAEHQLTLKNDAFSESQLTLNRCDTIKIVNLDAQQYELAFGTHAHHIEYPGYEIQTISPGQYMVVDAVEAGSFTMHDHLRDNAQVTFYIQP